MAKTVTIPNLRGLCIKLKAMGLITTLAPGHRIVAEAISRFTNRRVPSTKKQRRRYIARFILDGCPGLGDGSPILPPAPPPKKVKKTSKAEFNAFYFTREWRTLRYEALRRHGAACQCCGATAITSGRPMHVDHIKPRSKFPHLELSLSNLQVLCEDCNMGKGGRDQTDWRPAA